MDEYENLQEAFGEIQSWADECSELRAENARLTQELDEARGLLDKIRDGRAFPAFCSRGCQSNQIIEEFDIGEDGPAYECTKCGIGWLPYKDPQEHKHGDVIEEDDIPF